MSASRKPETEERLDQVMTRLEAIVGQLERGELPLEDALKVFEEGVGLVKRGQTRLEDMERRVEQLMVDGRTTQPLPDSAGKQANTQRPQASDDDDIPY